jgi:hypothetical protein
VVAAAAASVLITGSLAGCLGGGLDPLPDGAAPDAGVDLPVTDLPRQPDLLVPKLCQQECLDLALYACVKDKSGSCAMCTEDKHCVQNPYSLGTKCDTTYGFCTCGADADCKNKQSGPVCDKTYKFCSCKLDSDCPKNWKCAGVIKTTAGKVAILYCRRSCLSDLDCHSETAPRCDRFSGYCGECGVNADCAKDPGGGICDLGSCTCKNDEDCQGAYVGGSVCVSSLLQRVFCGCKDDTGCKGVAMGPHCDLATSTCSCKADTECTTSPYTLCAYPSALPLPGAKGTTPARRCEEACKTDADCADHTGLKTCNTKTGRCAECLKDGDCLPMVPYCSAALGICTQCRKDADCTTTSATYCLTSTGRCVACRKDPECTDKSAPYCDTSTGTCGVCTKDTHCSGNEGGPTCKDGACICAADADCKSGYPAGFKCVTPMLEKTQRCGCDDDAQCKGNPHGPDCDTIEGRCTCASNADCKAPYTLCVPQQGSLFTYYHCEKPCKSDADCVTSGKPACDTASGKCVECTKEAHCTSSAKPGCNTSTFKCVACTKDSHCSGEEPLCRFSSNTCVMCKVAADCASSRYGKVCTSNNCTCTGAADCTGFYAWGAECVNQSGYGNRCGCLSTAKCLNNANGPTCDTSYGVCTCAKDTDCKKTPLTTCGQYSSAASFFHCHKPCTSDADCKALDAGLDICLTTTKQCVECTKDADCAAVSSTKKYCLVASNTCVSCKTNAHCASNTFTKTCVPAKGCVECVKDADCGVDSLGNKCTANNFCACASDADCANRNVGHKCGKYAACECLVDGDCPSGKTCSGTSPVGKACK